MWDFLKYVFNYLTLRGHSLGFICSQAYVDFTNIFINFVKESLTGDKIRGRVGAFGRVRALIKVLLLLTLDLYTVTWPANLSCSLVRLAGG